ncbi:MAG: putative toxin-antitoxin system toxin component, PIN family [Sutterellaceae bacterium]|nr:putative toxin-antitoxin system toxin component, PIN family [Sutterellaceae bacterium]
MTELDASDYRFAKLPTADFLLSLQTQEAVLPETMALCERTKPLLVIDTNVWLDILYWDDVQTRELASDIENGTVDVCITLAAIEELADVVSRKYFVIDPERQLSLLKHVLSVATLVAPPPGATAKCRDTDDQKFLDLAQSVGADFLVTKDKLVLKAGKRLKKYGVLVLTPQDVRFPLDAMPKTPSET